MLYLRIDGIFFSDEVNEMSSTNTGQTSYLIENKVKSWKNN